MIARRVVVAWPLVIMTRLAGWQNAMAWSTDAVRMAENCQVTGIVRILDRSRAVCVRQIQEDPDEAGTRQLRHAMQTNFRPLKGLTHRLRDTDRARDKAAYRRPQSYRNKERALDVFITKTRHVERIGDRITPGCEHGAQILRQ